VTWLHVLIGALGLFGGALYILRAGNFSPIPASAFEHLLRDYMDMSLPVRPRTKEFLVGYPALILLAASIRCRQSGWSLLLAVGGTVAAVSVVNSFCHLACSPLLNVLRSYIALFFAFVPGLLLIPVFLLLRRIKGRSIVVVGYYGYGNAGDDSILASIVKVVRKNLREGDEIVVPVKPSSVKEVTEKFNVKAVSRYCPWSLFPELVRCRLLIYGGGGLFQDKTGYLTIPYYGAYAILCRLLCTEKIIMLGQGIGDISSSFLGGLTGHIANLCDFVQGRDKVSVDNITDLGCSYAVQGADVFLWNLHLSVTKIGHIPKIDGKPVIGVALRPDEELDLQKLKLIASGINSYACKSKAKVRLLSFHPDSDTSLMNQFASFLDESVEVTLHEIDFESMVSLAEECDVLVAMRYHAVLSSFIAGTPVIGLSYASKTDNIFSEGNYKYWCKLDDIEPDTSFVDDSLNDIFSRYKDVSEEVARLRTALLKDVHMSIEAAESELG
jgi:polysaccharide pyruvyl transferase CsaB